jgi:hypothetical protein
VLVTGVRRSLDAKCVGVMIMKLIVITMCTIHGHGLAVSR